ncbi:hypothetical protein GCM10027590_68220 [Nocardiopsis nanhaiensis]
MAAVRALAPNSVLRRMITSPKGDRVLDVGRTQRDATGALRDAGLFGHTTCAWPQGCNFPASGSEADHKQSFSAGGSTSADNIQPLCSDHSRPNPTTVFSVHDPTQSTSGDPPIRTH